MAKPEDTWFIGEGLCDDQPVLLRGRQNVDQLVQRTAYPDLLRIALSYEPYDKSGLPDAETNEQLTQLEDKVFDALEQDLLCVFFCISTYNGIREWVAYTRSEQEAGERLEACFEGEPPFSIEVTIEDDPEWEEYRSLLEDAGMDE